MPGQYTVTIKPMMIAEGKQDVHLEYLHFTATAGDDTQRCWSVNSGTLSEDFRALFGDWGADILGRLRKGETVKLPRAIDLAEARAIGGAGND